MRRIDYPHGRPVLTKGSRKPPQTDADRITKEDAGAADPARRSSEPGRRSGWEALAGRGGGASYGRGRADADNIAVVLLDLAATQDAKTRAKRSTMDSPASNSLEAIRVIGLLGALKNRAGGSLSFAGG